MISPTKRVVALPLSALALISALFGTAFVARLLAAPPRTALAAETSVRLPENWQPFKQISEYRLFEDAAAQIPAMKLLVEQQSELRTWTQELLEQTERGQRVSWWDRAYRGILSQAAFNAQGLVASWEPEALAPVAADARPLAG